MAGLLDSCSRGVGNQQSILLYTSECIGGFMIAAKVKPDQQSLPPDA